MRYSIAIHAEVRFDEYADNEVETAVRDLVEHLDSVVDVALTDHVLGRVPSINERFNLATTYEEVPA